jgi:hypothetical protein
MLFGFAFAIMEDFMSKKIDLANFNNQCGGNV